MWMADGRREEMWNYTSHIMAALHNSNPYRSNDAKPSDFNPTLRSNSPKEPDIVLPLAMLSGLIAKPPVRPPGQLIGGGTTPATLPHK